MAGGTLLNQNITYTFGDDSSLSGANANLSTPSLAVTGAVFSGNATWAGASGSYGTAASWDDDANALIHAAPGTFATFANVDKATLSGSGGTVSLNGAAPSLKSIVFGGSNAYTLAQGSSGSVILNGSGVGITASSTGHSITASVNLAADAEIAVTTSGDTLAIGGAITETGGARAITKTGNGTLTLTNSSNNYTGKTTVGNGTLSFSVGNASSTADQQLGKNTALDIGVASTSSGTLLYTGGTGTLAKNINAVGNGNNTIENNGGATLTLSDTVTKNGTTLVLKSTNAGSQFLVSGAITGTSANSDLIIDGGTTVLTNANNDYNGPTTAQNAGTLQVGDGTSGAITSTGTVTVTGAGSKLSGSGSIAGSTILGSGTILAPGVGSNTDTDNRTLTFTAVSTAVAVQDGGQIQLGLTSSTKIDSGFDWVANDANTYLNTLTSNGTVFTNSAYTTNWRNAESTYDSIKLTTGIFNLGVTTGGTVKLLDNSPTYTIGNIFKLLDWSTVGTPDSLLVGSGNFALSNLNFDSVALGSGLGWDTSAFTTYGIIVVVPEPSRVLLLMLGLMGLMLRRRRCSGI